MDRLHCQSCPKVGSNTLRGVPIAIMAPAATRKTAVKASIREVVQSNSIALSSSLRRALYTWGYLPIVNYIIRLPPCSRIFADSLGAVE